MEEYFWTNVEVDCQIDLDKDTLAKLLLGVVDIMDAHETNKVTTETKLSNEKTKQLLKTLFPKNQFLALDYW